MNRLQPAADYFEAVLRRTTYDRMPTLRIWAVFFLAEAHYYLNEVGICRQYLAEITDHRYSARPTHFYQALAGTALIDQMENRPINAWEMLDELSQLDLEKLGYENSPDTIHPGTALAHAGGHGQGREMGRRFSHAAARQTAAVDRNASHDQGPDPAGSQLDR